MKIKVMITGRSYHTAQHLPEELELDASATLEDLIGQINARLPADQSLSDACLLILDDRHLGTLARHDPATLRDGSELVLVAPVAGG